MDHTKILICFFSYADYEQIFDDLGTLTQNWKSVILGKKWAYTGGASFAIYNAIPEDVLDFGLSPVMLMKSRKNDVEIAGVYGFPI